jgi:hypothetical protein
MSFDLSNHSLKIQESIRTLTPKVGVHLGVRGLIPSHSHTLVRVNVTPMLHSRPTPFHALASVTNLRLGL